MSVMETKSGAIVGPSLADRAFRGFWGSSVPSSVPTTLTESGYSAPNSFIVRRRMLLGRGKERRLLVKLSGADTPLGKSGANVPMNPSAGGQ